MFVIIRVNLNLMNVINTWINDIQSKESKFLHCADLEFFLYMCLIVNKTANS